MSRLRWVSVLLVLSLLLASLPVQAQEPRPLNDEMLQAELTAFIRNAMQTYSVPGAAVALVQRSKTVYAQGFGVRALGSDEPVTEETVFPVGSLTAGMTTLMVAGLADDELLTWDTPAAEIYPDFKLADETATDKVSIRDLLGMTASLPRRDLAWVQPGLTAEAMLAGLADVELLDAAPGEVFTDSPAGFAAGAYIATIAAGGEPGNLRSAYVDLMQKRVFTPVYMLSATFDRDAVAAGENYAAPYDLLPAHEVIPSEPQSFDFGAPATGVYANVADMARYLMVQVKQGIANPLGDRAVSEENLTETNRAHVLLGYDSDVSWFMPTAENFGYGMGWYSATMNGMEVFFAPGYAAGATALAAFIPELNAGIVILTNLGGADYFTFSVFHMLYALAMNDVPTTVDQLQEIYNLQLEAQAEIPFASEFTADYVERFLGEYAEGWAVSLDEETGALWLTLADRAWRLVERDIAVYVVGTGWLRGSIVEFVDNDQGGYFLDITTPYGDHAQFDPLPAAE